MSTRIELSKEVEKLLNKARSLNLRNESYYNIKSTSLSMNTVYDELDLEDNDFNNDLDVIDVHALNLSDDETWLYESESNMNRINDLNSWLKQDIEEIKNDSRYLPRQMLLQYEINRLNSKIGNNSPNNNNIDSRTFTRPKKKITRPSLESINSAFKYMYKTPDSVETESYEPTSNFAQSKDISDLRLSIFKTNELIRQQIGNISNEINRTKHFDLSNSTKDIECSNQRYNDLDLNQKLNIEISNQERTVSREKAEVNQRTNNDFSNEKKDLEMSNSLEDIIRGQMRKLDMTNCSKFNLKALDHFETVQNASPPPSLMMNSFSSNFQTSLTESDFITAVNQPQDLYTSYTSTISTIDLNDDQKSIIAGDETFAQDVRNLHETFSRDIQENVNDATFVGNNSSESSSFDSGNDLNSSLVERKNVTIVIQRDTPERDVDADNTFTKLHISNKISLSDPNLRNEEEDPVAIHENFSNRTFTNSKHSDHTNESSDSLDITGSFSSINSNHRLGNEEDFETVPKRPAKLSLQKRQQHSTPKIGQKLFKQTWSSSVETLSPISTSSSLPCAASTTITDLKTMGGGRLKSARSMSIPRNALNDTKVLNSIESTQNQRLLKQLDKTHDIYKTTEDVRSLKEPHIPTMIVKPMEIKRPPVPPNVPASIDTNKLDTTTVISKPVTSQMNLRQPSARSGLPRPISTTGIPRPHSRLPVPRSFKPATKPTSAQPPSQPTKNNWMDGCY